MRCVPRPMRAPSSITAYAPMATSSPSSTPFSITAVGWTSRIAIDDAREELRLGRERTLDERFAVELPNVRFLLEDGHVEIEPVARDDRPAEFRFVDSEKIHQRLRVERLAR